LEDQTILVLVVIRKWSMKKKFFSLNFNPSAFPVGPFHGEYSLHFTQRKFSTCNRLSSQSFNTLIEIIKLMSKGTDITMVFKDFFFLPGIPG